MNALLLLFGFIAGVVTTVALTNRVERDVPQTPEPAPERKPDEFDAAIAAIEQWNQALLNVPAVKRPMIWKETRQ
jgi:hypothetical protein